MAKNEKPSKTAVKGRFFMKNFFNNLKYKINVWMQGRYGSDEFSRFLTIAALVLFVLSICKIPFVYALGVILLFWSLFRSFSKNFYKRQKERETYLRLQHKVTQWFKLQKNKWQDRKTHRYFRCPGCKAVLRVPKGRGNIRIRCSKCGREINKKT